MNMSNLKEHFLTEVMQNIKSREAKEVVHKELSYHLKMSKAEWISKGANEKEAEEKSIKQMGSPAELGVHFNKLYRPIFDWKLFGLFMVIISMGILPIINVQEYYPEDLLVKQMAYIVLGIMVSISVMLIDYRKIKNIGWLSLIVALGLLLVMNFFPNMILNGVSNFRILGFTISGISLLPFFLVFWAFYLSRERPNLIVVMCIYALTVFLFIGLSSVTVVFIYSIFVLTQFYFSSIKRKAIYTTIGVTIGMFLSFVCIFWFTAKEYQRIRLVAIFNPDEYAHNAGYMNSVIKKLIKDGGWIGNPKPLDYMLEMTTDLAFANITYFYGWILSGFLFVLLSLLLFRLIILSTQIKDRFGKQLILGICSLLSIQFV